MFENLLENLPASLLRLGILFSGQGSNMQALIESLHQRTFLGKKPIIIEVALCLTNKSKAPGIARAQKLGVPCVVLEPANYAQTSDFERALIEHLSLARCHLVLLAGYMRLVSPLFLEHFPTLNIHPSMLPHFKGKDALRASFEAKEGTGVSVHVVTPQLDSGPIIAQQALNPKPQESLESFTQRIHALEHQLYPKALLQALGLERFT
ncbi:phosphoribosylglycinamide formyltransferase [Helicobacter baculiformis]|uniref:Phosphoribosylglycinamide formyltransferase n=1 Tax=Helicobacter baculiformis TaxID=427351 RepID=A0ABV7ZFV8_9HELI|nr:phosphoribosylglycinamide formyltransferase [Helicobacter baculiformis]